MGKKGGDAPAPDPQMGVAARMQAETGQQWLDFARGAYGESMQRQRGIDTLAEQVTRGQIDAQRDASTWAREDRARWKSVIQPLQDQFIDKAKNWDSAGAQANAAAEAKADVANNFATQDAMRTRAMAAQGVNPNSGRFAGVERASDAEAALAGAGAQNNARSTLRKQAMALQGEAINMGSGLPSQASSALGLGVNAGSAAMGTTVGAQQPRMQALGVMGQGFGGAMQGYAGAANTYGQMFNAQMQSYNAQQQQSSGLMSGLGSLAGMFLGPMMSDENEKEDKRPVRGVLDALKEMPVESWRYKGDSPANDGGAQHVGTYAQDFKEATGLGDGKTINAVDAIGVTMGAVKELAEKVEGLEEAIEGRNDNPREERAERSAQKTQPRRAAGRKPQSRSIMEMAA